MTELKQDWSLLNGLALAYIGDAVYEVFVRQHLLETGQTRPNDLHRHATGYVSAVAQNHLIQEMMQNDFLTEIEISMFKRGRNAKSHTTAKNADVGTYRASTGFEAMIGYLHMSKQEQRLKEVVAWCIQKVEENNNGKLE